MIRYIFLIAVFFITFQSGFSQSARKVLKEGNVYFEQKQYRKALYKFSNYIDKKKSSGDVYLKIARCLYETSQLENAEDYLTNYLESTKHPDVNGFLLYADIYHSKLDFKHAIEYYKKYLAESKKNKSERAIVRDKIRRCAFGLRQGTSSSSVIVENMGAKVNSYNDDFRPILSPNYTDKLYFSSIRSGNLGGKRNVIGREDKMGDYSSDMFSTQVINGDWGNVKRLSSLTNTPRHDVILDFNGTGKALFFFKGFTLFAGDVLVDTFRVGKKPLYPNKFLSPFHPEKGDRGLCFYQDTIMFFASNRLEGFGGFDIYISFHKKQGWTKPLNLGSEINSVYDEVSPFLSADGKTLYFIRGQIRGTGGRNKRNGDIYVSKLQEDGSWGVAEKLPDNINTPYSEASVFIHPDGRTLYFASNGHVGMGGYDLYMTQLQADGTWSNPINLGYPINTAADENSLLVFADGNLAIFASDRAGGFGDLDLYQFELPESVKPTRTIYMEGLVYNAKTKEKLEAEFSLIDLSTGKEVVHSISDYKTGEFIVTLPTNRDYALIVNKKGYNPFSVNFNLTVPENSTEPYHMDAPLIPMNDLGKEVVLKNVFFDLDSYRLRKESYIELDNLVAYLNEHPNMKIELQGHTDAQGDDAHNMELSKNRAKAVMDYLITKGIDKSRLTYAGYGETKPAIVTINGKEVTLTEEYINSLKTDKEKKAAHQLNRRTVYVVKSL